MRRRQPTAGGVVPAYISRPQMSHWLTEAELAEFASAGLGRQDWLAFIAWRRVVAAVPMVTGSAWRPEHLDVPWPGHPGERGLAGWDRSVKAPSRAVVGAAIEAARPHALSSQWVSGLSWS